jgi:hypothetical protein
LTRARAAVAAKASPAGTPWRTREAAATCTTKSTAAARPSSALSTVTRTFASHASIPGSTSARWTAITAVAASATGPRARFSGRSSDAAAPAGSTEPGTAGTYRATG